MIPEGFCQCGCGRPTNFAQRDNSKWGHIKGQPFRYLCGHSNKGPKNHFWKSGRRINKKGYVYLCRQRESWVIVEEILGCKLPVGAVVHHVNGSPSDNRPQNLVVCQDRRYHLLLHRRERALHSCGHASWRLCKFCKKYDHPGRIFFTGGGGYHRECRKKHDRAYYSQNQERKIEYARERRKLLRGVRQD